MERLFSSILANPKSVRPVSTNSISNSANKQRVRCSLCDSLLKASTSHRYLLIGKSIHDSLDKNITYGEFCKRYLSESCDSNKFHMLCPKCCHNLQHIYSLHKDAEQLTEKIRHTCYKTKRLNRARHSHFTLSRTNENVSSSPLPIPATDDNIIITIKEELEIEPCSSDIKTTVQQSPITASESLLANIPHDLSNTQYNLYSLKMLQQPIDHNHQVTNRSKAKPRVSLAYLHFEKQT